MASNFDEAYQVTYDEEADVSTSTCGAWRIRNGPDDAVQLKYGTPYTTRSGFKIYDSPISWFPVTSDTGEAVEMTFVIDAAAALTSTTIAITLALLN